MRLGVRDPGSPDSAGRQTAVVEWLWLFDAATGRAADRALAYCDDITALQERWRLDLGAVRANSGMNRLPRVLPGSPVLTVESASRRLDVSPNRVGPAVNALVEANVLSQRNAGRQRYRLFSAPAVLDLWGTVDAELVAPRPRPASESGSLSV